MPEKIVTDSIPHSIMVDHIRAESVRFAAVVMSQQAIRQLARYYYYRTTFMLMVGTAYDYGGFYISSILTRCLDMHGMDMFLQFCMS